MTLATPTAPASDRTEAGPTPIHQLYVTHCLYGEGLSREAGFGVRASSTRDPLLLRFALEYPHYEWPRPRAEAESAAPRRLALVRVPGGRSALIHSGPAARDDCGRANNFFSHVFFAGALAADEALAAWGSPDWATDWAPGADNRISPPAGLPRGEGVSDRALTAFLQEPAPPTCPPRLADDLRRRRQLLSRAICGCLLALQAGVAAPRGRFYLLAEPELVALLLYGAARLLPRGMVQGLTFSTYESAQTTLPTYRHAQVVGTWLAEPARGLDDEYFTRRGYALDTVNDRGSDELSDGAGAALEEWIDLAARGEWSVINRLHGLLGKGATSVVACKDGARAARLARRVAAGEADADDLLALKQSPGGEPILAGHRDQVWPVVRDADLTDPRLREAFADLIRDNIPDLERRAARALRSHPPGDWQPDWRVIWSVLQGSPGELRETFERLLPEPPLPPALCFSVLAELQPLRLSAADPRVPVHALLKNFGAPELELFARSDLPREWFVWALCYALLRPDTRDAAAGHLHDGGDDLARVFWQQFKLLRDEGQRRAVLAALVATAGDRGPAFVSRLLAGGCGLHPDTLAWLLETLGAWKREWAEFWGRDDHLGRLLERVRAFGEAGAPVWERFCGEIDRGVLPPGDAYQHTLLMNLVAVAGRPGPRLPSRAAETIADWALLRDHFEKAAAVVPYSRPAVIAACNRRRLDPIDELSGYFTRFVEPQQVRDELLADFTGFFHSFFPEPAEYPDHETRLVGWLQVVGNCADLLKREAYQRYYLDRFVPVEFRRRLAEETHRAGKLLPEVYEAVQADEQRLAPAAGSSALVPDELHQLAGVRLGEGEARPSPLTFWQRLPWLLCALAAGVVAAAILGLYKPPTRRAAVLPAFMAFVPLVLLLADGIALQSVGLTARRLRRQSSLRQTGARALARELLSGLLLGVVCGLAASGVALGWGVPVRLALVLCGAVVVGAAAAAVIGFALAVLLGRMRGGWRVAAGPLARAAAGAAALLLYVLLARVFGT
jgi:hypothetical protein